MAELTEEEEALVEQVAIALGAPYQGPWMTKKELLVRGWKSWSIGKLLKVCSKVYLGDGIYEHLYRSDEVVEAEGNKRLSTHMESSRRSVYDVPAESKERKRQQILVRVATCRTDWRPEVIKLPFEDLLKHVLSIEDEPQFLFRCPVYGYCASFVSTCMSNVPFPIGSYPQDVTTVLRLFKAITEAYPLLELDCRTAVGPWGWLWEPSDADLSPEDWVNAIRNVPRV